MNNEQAKRSRRSWWYALFLVDCVILLWLLPYNRLEPTFGGIPFFYWYQLLCVIICTPVTAFVYFATKK